MAPFCIIMDFSGLFMAYTYRVVISCHVQCVWGQDATSTNIAYGGEAVTVDCPLTGSYTYPTWTKPDGTIYGLFPKIDPPSRIGWAANQRDLIVMNVTTTDAGTYTCSTDIDGVPQVGHHILHVRVLPDPPEIFNTELVQGELSVRGTEGQPLTLTCLCRGGVPRPTLVWYRNTATRPAVSVNSTTPTDSSATYVTVTHTFTPDRHSDKDIYICQSSFQEPQPEPINQTSVQLYLDLKPLSPTIQQIGDASAESIATLQCETSGFRPAGITTAWIYKGQEYRDHQLTQYVTVDTYRAGSTLQLPVQVEDNGGIVECIVNHSTLSSPLSAYTAMDVHFSPVSVAVSGNRHIVVNGAPRLTLTCTVGDANPAVFGFTWTGPGVGAMTSQTVTLRPTRDHVGAAVTCIATNTVGSTTSPAVILNLKYHPITTISEITSVTKTEGDGGIVLHCSADSRPVSTITWYHNNEQVYQGSHNNQLNFSLGTVNRTDDGTYTCKSDNGIPGTTADTEKSVTLSVLYPPTTVQLTGNDPGMVANGANTLTLTCTTDDSRPVSSILWEKGRGYLISADITPTVIPGAQYGGTRYRETLTLTPTRSDDGTVITCSAWNNAWNNVTAQPLMDRVQLDLTYSPVATIPGGHMTVIEGTPDVDLTCTASSKPAATFTWYQGNTMLGAGTGTLADNRWSNRIEEVRRSHSGQYRCEASNGIPPVDKQPVTLTVQYPPDVTATVTETGYGYGGTVNFLVSATIKCSPTGVPDNYTYYSWVHSWSDGQVISQPELSATQTLRLHNNLTYQNSGVYTCRVSNGVAQYGISDNIREGSTSFITMKSPPVIIEPAIVDNKVHKVYTKLHHPTNINITYYSNGEYTTVSCRQVINHFIQSPVGVVITEPAVIQLPMFDSIVTANAARVTVKLTIDDESQLGFYQVKVRTRIGTKTIYLEIISKAGVTDAEMAASTHIVLIVGGLVSALVGIVVVVGAVVLYAKGCRIDQIKKPGNKSGKYSVCVNDSGTDGREPPNETHRMPTISATQDNGRSATASAGTGPGSIYDEVDAHPGYEYARMP